MGQRLNLEIRKNGELLANSYYHWSGYSEPSINLALDAIMASFSISNPIKHDDKGFAVKMLEATGAGLDEEDYNTLTDKLKKSFNLGNDRNDGFIAFQDETMDKFDSYAEDFTTINFNTNKKLDELTPEEIIDAVSVNADCICHWDYDYTLDSFEGDKKKVDAIPTIPLDELEGLDINDLFVYNEMLTMIDKEFDGWFKTIYNQGDFCQMIR